MRTFLALLLIIAVVGAALAWTRYLGWLPYVSHETVTLDAGKRRALTALRAERKFEPDDMYTGIFYPEDAVTARSAVNDTLDSILSREDGPIRSLTVSALIGRALRRVDLLDTEDRDRTGSYMIEIWYILGFKGRTGHFDHGSAFTPPEGYGEPLPPGWQSPTEPRPIGEE